MRGRRVARIAATCAIGWLSCGAVLAAPNDQTGVPVAEALFAAGRDLMEKERYAEACEKFEASQRLDPSAGTLLNLGRCLELQGKSASAWAAYKQTIALGNTTNKARQVAAAEQYLKELEPKVSKLEVVVQEEVEGLVVRAGTVELIPAARGLAVPLDPGPYEVTAEAPGRLPWKGTVTLREGEPARLSIPSLELAPDHPPPPRLPGPIEPPSAAPGPFTIAGVAVGGGGVIAIAIGAAFGAMTLSEASELEDDPRLCPEKRCTRAGLAALDAAEDKASASTAMLVTGGLLAAAGAALVTYGILSKDGAPRATARVVVGDTMGVFVVGAW